MNEYEISVKNLLDTLPSVLAEDKNMYALATAAAMAIVKYDKEINSISIYPNIDNASEELCDILAKDFDVTWYNYDYDLDQKRRIIKANFNVHRHLGTKGAVSDLVAAAFVDGKVQEWFEYDGEPYHFKINLPEDSTFIMTQDTVGLFSRLIENVKSLRSRLDNIEVHKKTTQTVYLGTIVAPAANQTVNNDITMDSETYVESKALVAPLSEIISRNYGTTPTDTSAETTTQLYAGTAIFDQREVTVMEAGNTDEDEHAQMYAGTILSVQRNETLMEV